MAFDDREHHDAAPLIALLELDIELLPIVRDWLADLLRRYELRKRPGASPATSYERKVLALVKVLDVLPDAWSRLANPMSQRPQLTSMIERYDFIVPAHRPRVPMYDLSDIETRLHLAAEMVHNLNPPRGKLDEAITAAAARYGRKSVRLSTTAVTSAVAVAASRRETPALKYTIRASEKACKKPLCRSGLQLYFH